MCSVFSLCLNYGNLSKSAWKCISRQSQQYMFYLIFTLLPVLGSGINSKSLAWDFLMLAMPVLPLRKEHLLAKAGHCCYYKITFGKCMYF